MTNYIPQRTLLFSLFVFSLSFLPGCFDYHEEVEFKEDFSGTLRISYKVPVSKDHSSRLRFLASTKEDIREHYREAKAKLPFFQIRNIKITPIENEPSLKIKKGSGKGKTKERNKSLGVSYSLDFKDPRILEYTPLTNTKVLKSKEGLKITRSFRALQSLKKAKGFILERISKHLRKRFLNHSISYTTLLPESLALHSQKGQLHKDTRHSYRLALVETLRASKDIKWSLTLKK